MRVSSSLAFAVAAFIAGAAGTSWGKPPGGQGNGLAGDVAALQADVSALQTQVGELTALLAGVSRLTDPATGQDTLRFSAMNVQVVNGTGDTESANGVGNLIVGYNELNPTPSVNDRSGSHVLVVGIHNQYSSHGGVVVGASNSTSAPFASVTGGFGNSASGLGASVTGGASNSAQGLGSAVSGGSSNITRGLGYNSISGGFGGVVEGDFAGSISGGFVGIVTESYASVSGGSFRTAEDIFDWAGGSLLEDF